MLGALGIFVYVGAEVAIGSFLVNYFDDMNLTVIIAENQTMMNIANTIASTFNKTFSNSDPKSLLGIFSLLFKKFSQSCLSLSGLFISFFFTGFLLRFFFLLFRKFSQSSLSLSVIFLIN